MITEGASFRDAFLTRLKLARKRSGLTQLQVAGILKKPQSWVSKIESGERRLDVIEAQQLADVYGVSLLFFLGNDSEDVT